MATKLRIMRLETILNNCLKFNYFVYVITSLVITNSCFQEVEVPRILDESLIIDHPKLKTHGRTKMTCALKNMYACYKIKDKVKYHSFLDKAKQLVNIDHHVSNSKFGRLNLVDLEASSTCEIIYRVFKNFRLKI